MKTVEIREAFLSYFESQGHTRVASSSLVPENDPTLLFTNAGMNQFKDTFLGSEPRDYVRATSSQRCVRAGGKHNDLENVGYTARHHTFFEMLGNFSFGDYFKRDAIKFAWTFLTEVLGLPEDRLWVTVHVSDDEAADIWIKEMGVSAERFSRLDEDNFWQMGDTGPCGPSSEIFYDHGADVPGGPPGSENDDLDRYIEIWNLVFMQFNRDASGELHPLPKPSVDTGMGLERIAAVMQNVHSNYEIDLFQALIKAAAQAVNCNNLLDNSLRVIADHIRSCSFLIVDGVVPGNEGRGYVLRRIIRRAVRHGNKLGATEPFFYKLVDALSAQMGEAYPELAQQAGRVAQVLLQEEQQFAKTLDNGMQILEESLEGLQGGEIPGDIVFKLYDTYGFPVDLTNDIARERGLTLDMAGYDEAMAKQRARSQEGGKFVVDYSKTIALEGATEFLGYSDAKASGTVEVIIVDGEKVSTLAAGQQGVVVFDRTPFYAESGGQTGDTGGLTAPGLSARVLDTTKQGDLHLHHVHVESGELAVAASVSMQIDEHLRDQIRANHSATHLLHAALRQVLGGHVQQKGSLVTAERLRFDFSHSAPVTADELAQLNAIVNAQVMANTEVSTRLMNMDEAVQAGAMALFGEKYGDEVRVLAMGTDSFSVELCGGTHVGRTGDIGVFRIVSESGIAAGVRRIEAVTGVGALAEINSLDTALQGVCLELKAQPENVVSRVAAMRGQIRELEKQIDQLKMKMAQAAGGELASQAIEVRGVPVLAARLDGADAKALRDAVDQMKSKLGDSVVLLASVVDDKIVLAAGVSKAVTDRVKAGDLMREFATRLGGKGGGRPDMAQGGGTDVAALNDVLGAVPAWVDTQLP
ncbi:Alanyl-tRNA synthetase [Aequoribacter fuscus]|uniref:Alanine--tRNA ligase n=2 Tax=Aequoribacter TaxID=2847769 RepID=F3KZT3_9GAMM|nr:alanine--tRNA ligase [Aequoribacter fuscus]EGG30387.1 Alanyl-tRNA synthetase [Aequoribacter fuscus]QHJ88499.1 alanine--tRNA ligase [Aequoribacter fuscus]